MSPDVNFEHFSSDYEYAVSLLKYAMNRYYKDHLLVDYDDISSLAYIFMCDAWSKYRLLVPTHSFRAYLRNYVTFSFMNYVRNEKPYNDHTFANNDFVSRNKKCSFYEKEPTDDEDDPDKKERILLAQAIKQKLFEHFRRKDQILLEKIINKQSLSRIAKQHKINKTHLYYINRRFKALLHKALNDKQDL